MAASHTAPFPLAGRTALMTGGGRGIGRACALALAGVGAAVTAVARTPADLHSLSLESEGLITGWIEDVTSDSFQSRLDSGPPFDVMLNNAGMNRPLAMGDVDLATLDAMIDLNIRTVFRTSQTIVRGMLRAGRGGSIIHMSSQMGHVGAARRTVTKHAIEGLTKAMAIELAPSGIRVNAIAPTFIETDLTREMLAEPTFHEDVISSIPLGRVGQPTDLTGAVIFRQPPTHAQKANLQSQTQLQGRAQRSSISAALPA